MLKYFRPSIIILVLCSALDVFAQSTLPYNENFRNATAPGMVFGGSEVLGDRSHKAFLTAFPDSAGFNSNTLDKGDNPIAPNPNDAIGGGYLRLTKNAQFQAGYARNTTHFPSANGLSISFEYYTFGGGGGDGDSKHADGISVFLYDASTTSFTFGANGGSLGYAQRSGGGGPTLPGVSKGYLGIGFDEFGNFATIADGKSGGNDVDGTPGPDTWSEPNSDNVTIRGDGDGDSNAATNYDWKTSVLVNQAPFNFGIRGNIDGRSTINPSTRPAGGLLPTESGYRKVKIDLDPINNGSLNGFKINVYITIGTGVAAVEKHVIVDYLYYGDGDRPVSLSYGFGASTGDKTNIHEIRGLTIVVPASTPLDPNTGKTFSKSGLEDAASITFSQGDFYNTDYSTSNFTDPNGDALANVRITNLPDPLHGVLKLGGVDIIDEEIIPYANLANISFVPTANYNGSASFTWRGGDAGGLYAAADATVNITITPVNDEPSFTKGANQTVNEDSGVQTITGWATAISKGHTNESSQIMTFTVTNDNNALFSSQPTINSSGDLTYTPAVNANGTATVSVILTDNGGTANGGDDTFATQTFTITVTAVNDEPSFTKGANQTVIEDSGVQTVTGWATVISKGPVNENGQSVTFTVTNDNNALFSSQPTINSSGDLTYTPAVNANGTATVSVILSDNGGTANGGDDTFATQTFTITVTAVNDEPSFTKGANQTVTACSVAQTVAAWATVISKGPADENGQTLIFSVTNDNNALFSSQPTINTSGNLTYTAAVNANGTATVSVVLKDDGGVANGGDDTFATQTFTITVNGTAQPSAISGLNVVCIGTTGVTYSVTNEPGNTYSWTYSGTGHTITAGAGTNSITVSYSSSATSGTWSVTATNTTTTCTSIARTYAVVVNSTPQPGTVTGTASVCVGTTGLTYSVTNVANTTYSWVYSGTGATISSGGGTNTITVAYSPTATSGNWSVTATGTNNCASIPRTFAVTLNTLPTVAAITGTLDVCTGLTTQLLNATTGGTWSSNNTSIATVNSNTGVVTGVAAGTATLTYTTAANGNGCVNTTSATVTVNALPTVAAITGASGTTIGSTTPLACTTTGGIWSSSNTTIATVSTTGLITGVAAGTVTITYALTSGTCTGSATKVITITTASVNNSAPVIANISMTGTMDLPVIFASNDFTSKFTDLDGDALSKIKIVTLPASGTLKLNGVNIVGGQEIPLSDLSKITFVPPAGFSGGPISFLWNASDGIDYASTPKNVNITITVNTLPVAANDNYSTTKGGTLTVAAPGVLINDSDANLNPITAIRVTGPANGTLTLNANGSFTYIHDNGTSISDSFTYKVNDGIADGNTVTVRITVVNASPVVSNISKTSTGFLPVTFSVTDFTNKFEDPNGDLLVKVKIVTLPPNGVLKLNGIPVTANQEIPVADLGSLTFEPALNWSGTANFTWNGSDGASYAAANANAAITVITPIDPNAKIGLAKNMASITPALNATYDVKFVFTAVNFGPNSLENISIKDNLALAFGGAEVTVKTVTAFGNLMANSSFNGVTNTELLLPGSRLVSGEEAKVELLINVKLLLTSGVFQNTASAEAISSITGFKVSDVSTNGLRPDPNSTADVSPSVTTPIKLDPFPTYVPAGFSPNGDGMNDKFVVQNAKGKHVSLEMYNRWGNRVYKSDDYKNDWGGEVTEGFFLGRDIPDGTYYYIIIIDKKDKYVGFITVNR